MKRSERHHLKENELAAFVDRARGVATDRRGQIVGVLVLALVAVAAVLGYMTWRNRNESKAATLLTDALTVLEAQVTTPAPAAPGQTAPTPPTGTYQSVQAKLEAALPKLTAVYTQYPSAESAVAARYHAANALAVLGRRADAETQYKEVADEGGFYGQMARLGLADLFADAGQHDQAIAIYKELSGDPGAAIPVDGVLMQLGRVYAKAGRRSEAQQTYTRIVQDFPDSLYVTDARRQIETLKKS